MMQKPQDVRVLWIVQLPPDCAHVRLIEAKTSCKGEEEYLFPPYSGFIVNDCRAETGRYVVELTAVSCNKSEDEGLLSAPWS